MLLRSWILRWPYYLKAQKVEGNDRKRFSPGHLRVSTQFLAPVSPFPAFKLGEEGRMTRCRCISLIYIRLQEALPEFHA